MLTDPEYKLEKETYTSIHLDVFRPCINPGCTPLQCSVRLRKIFTLVADESLLVVYELSLLVRQCGISVEFGVKEV